MTKNLSSRKPGGSRGRPSTSSSSTRPSPQSHHHQIPTPFVLAPSSLAVFTDRLDPALVYITHIDRTPTATKKSIFAIPVVLNGVIAGLLAWRAYIAAPKYLALVQTVFGFESAATVDPTRNSQRAMIGIVLRRTLMFLLDFLLARFIGPWPLTFFFEKPQNPCSWRWSLGYFRDEELIVRQSRGWGTSDLMRGVRQGDENAFFKTRILPAVEKEFMRKTGYLMMDRSWDLDFELMLDGHALAERTPRELRFEELDKVVWGHLDGVGWLMWQWEGPDRGGDVIEERRKKVVAFKDKLTALGKESLFWKWMEIVEEERDLDGDFTAEKQARVARRVQDEFDKEGIDFEALSKSIGGLQEIKPK